MLRTHIKSNHMSVYATSIDQTKRSTFDAGPAIDPEFSPSNDCEEVKSAALYIAGLIAGDNNNNTDIVTLTKKLRAALMLRYQGHWFPQQPLRGSGFRCLTFPSNGMDPLVGKVCEEVGIDATVARNAFPSPEELMIWIDPNSVTSRLSDRHGLLNTIYGTPVTLSQGNRAMSAPNPKDTRAGSRSPPLERSSPGSPPTSLSARANSFTPMRNSPPGLGNIQSRRNLLLSSQATSWKSPMTMSPPPGIVPQSGFNSIMA